MHLKQPLMHARVHTGGDEGPDLQAFPGQGMLVVSITVVESDVPSVSGRW